MNLAASASRSAFSDRTRQLTSQAHERGRRRQVVTCLLSCVRPFPEGRTADASSQHEPARRPSHRDGPRSPCRTLDAETRASGVTAEARPARASELRAPAARGERGELGGRRTGPISLICTCGASATNVRLAAARVNASAWPLEAVFRKRLGRSHFLRCSIPVVLCRMPERTPMLDCPSRVRTVPDPSRPPSKSRARVSRA